MQKLQDIDKSEIPDVKAHLQQMRGKTNKRTGLKFGQKFPFQGKNWLVYDFDADSSFDSGVSVTLVSPSFDQFLRGVDPEAGLTEEVNVSISGKLDELNKVLADVETGLLYDLMPGMAGYGSSSSPYSVETPEFDAQPYGGDIDTRPE
jgi:hypothetical protein